MRKGVEELVEISLRLDELERLMTELGPECDEIARAVGVPLANALDDVAWAKRGIALEIGQATMVERRAMANG